LRTLQRERSERPCDRRTSKKADEMAPPHSYPQA
jgi:hypothetical protein